VSGTQLTFIISGTSVSYAEVLRSSQTLTRSGTHSFSSSRTEERKEELEEFLRHANLNQEYEEYSLAVCSTQTALVPIAIFSASSPSQVVNLLFEGEIDKNDIDFNRISELSVVNVYTLPLWIKSLFIMKFPKMLIQHEQTMNIRALFQGSTFNLKIVLTIFEEYFSLNIIHKSELVFSNVYAYTAMEDLVYYTQFALKNKGLENERASLLGVTASHDSEGLFKSVAAALTKMHGSPNYDVSTTQIFQQQVLCV